MLLTPESPTREELVREVQELEDSYAEALADGTDARTLSLLWERIKLLNQFIEAKRVNGL